MVNTVKDFELEGDVHLKQAALSLLAVDQVGCMTLCTVERAGQKGSQQRSLAFTVPRTYQITRICTSANKKEGGLVGSCMLRQSLAVRCLLSATL